MLSLLSFRRNLPCAARAFFGFILWSALLFAAAAPAQAQISRKPLCAPDTARLDGLRQAQTGIFRAMRLAQAPLYLGDLQFQNAEGARVKLADFSGKTLLVNLWGVWCPPCRKEMPDLAQLQKQRGGKDFAVLTIYDQASGKEKVRAFLAGLGAENLPLYHDADMSLYNALKEEGLARGLPVSLLVDARGCLVASVNGGVPWSSADALSFIAAAEKL